MLLLLQKYNINFVIVQNSRGEVKLSDFGISKELDSSTAMSHTAVGSYRYMSPERLLGEKYDASGDIWSVGITIVQLWTKSYPFSSVADTPIDLFGELEHFNFDRVVSKTVFPPLMRKFIRSTLATNPDQRFVKLYLSVGHSLMFSVEPIVVSWRVRSGLRSVV
jgi:serine/threonine protein kinase